MSLYLGRSGSHSSPRRRSSRRGRAGRSSAPGSPGLSGTSPGSCGQTGLPGRLEKEAWSALTHHSSMHCLCMAQSWLGCPKPWITTLRDMGPMWVVQPWPGNRGHCGWGGAGDVHGIYRHSAQVWGCKRAPTDAPGTAPNAGQVEPTSLTAGAHEPWRADAFANVVVADAAVQTVGTVLLTGWSPLLRRAGCRESRGGQSATCHKAGYSWQSPAPRQPGPCSPLTMRR